MNMTSIFSRHQKTLCLSLLLTLVFESLTLFFRFGLDLQTSRDTASTLALLTQGIRIHHSYIGVLILLVYFCCFRRLMASELSPLWQTNTIILIKTYLPAIGLALIFSDLIHHFLVLWPLEGAHHFDLVYPGF